MKILICGGRDFKDYPLMSAALFHFQERYGKIDCIVHGGARGADLFADEWGGEMGIKTKSYPADWNKYGKAAGPIRNGEMLKENPDIRYVIAFPGGAGTRNMCARAKKYGIPVLYGVDLINKEKV